MRPVLDADVCFDCNWQALKCLRRKKLLDTRQAQHEQAIDKINTMLHMLQETESQKQVQAHLRVMTLIVVVFGFVCHRAIVTIVEHVFQFL